MEISRARANPDRKSNRQLNPLREILLTYRHESEDSSSFLIKIISEKAKRLKTDF